MTMKKMTRQNKDPISVFPKIKTSESEKGRRRDKRPKPPKEKLMMRTRDALQEEGEIRSRLERRIDSVARMVMRTTARATRTTMSKSQVASRQSCEQKFALYYSIYFPTSSQDLFRIPLPTRFRVQLQIQRSNPVNLGICAAAGSPI